MSDKKSPACLHCNLLLAIDAWSEKHRPGDNIPVSDVIDGLIETVADVIMMLPQERRPRVTRIVDGLLREKLASKSTGHEQRKAHAH